MKVVAATGLIVIGRWIDVRFFVLPPYIAMKKRTTIYLMLAAMEFAVASPARACLNDTRVEAAENEFRSRYESVSPVPQAPSDALNPAAVEALVGGGGLLGAGGVVAFKRNRRGGR